MIRTAIALTLAGALIAVLFISAVTRSRAEAVAGSAPPVATSVASAAPTETATPRPPGPLPVGRVEKGTFRSSVLNRTMPFTVYLPPGYDTHPAARYPTLYLLHGGGGTNTEWADYGALDVADRLMGSGEIPPFIIVLPQGDQEYWVDHITSRIDNGEKWGTYTAREVVPEIDRRYRTMGRQDERAIGGLSMGAHAAIQLPMNFPGIWSVIGSHSPSIRPEGDAPSYLGRGAEYAARDPLSLIRAKPELARTYTWWIDSGEVDPWVVQATAIHTELERQGIAHEWHPFPGDHALDYWSAHMVEYLRYYAGALCRTKTTCVGV